MNLSTLFFVFAFLPVSLILYLVCPRVCKNALLVLISFVFYAWGSPVYLLLLLLVTVFNYCVGLDIGNCAELGQRGTKFLLVIGVLFNLLLLGFYKYAAFAIETLNAILPFTLNAPSAALPLGISFFTFQNLSYLSDVYHRRAPAQKNPLDFCLYVSFFPKMISGPIVEYAQFEPQLKSHPVTLYKVSEAVPMLVLGLAKKVLLADNLGAAFQSISALSSGSLSGGSAWLGAICYSLQLYFDFSGYSDMAIGMGRIFGFKYMENFRLPYTAKSITDFWRRWHISLSSFFRDYVYIPLGGKKKHRLLNMAIVWALTGMWHGASWNFVLWGLYFFVILAIEKQLGEKSLRRVPYLLRRLGTMLLIIFGWNIFYYTDMTRLVQNFGVMFGLYGAGFSNAQAGIQLTNNLPLLLLCAIGATSIPRNLGNLLGGVCAQGGKKSGQIVYAAVSFVFDAALLALSTIALVGSTYNAFLYFRF